MVNEFGRSKNVPSEDQAFLKNDKFCCTEKLCEPKTNRTGIKEIASSMSELCQGKIGILKYNYLHLTNYAEIDATNNIAIFSLC